MKTQTTIIVLVIMLASCVPPGTYTPTENATEMAVPTNTYPPTHPPLPTATAPPTPTFSPTPSVWQIWFEGFSCEGIALCDPGPSQVSYYFSINSDGTELKTLQISAFPTPQLPNAAPPLPVAFATVPQLSPDKSTLTYSARDGDNYSLYIVDVTSGRATRLYQTKKIQDHLFWLGTACWSPTGKTIEFLIHSRRGHENQPPVLYTIDLDGNNLEARFSLPGLENSWFGDCSPDGNELVLSIPGNSNVTTNGLYLINRNTGHSRQILSGYSVSVVRIP